MANVDLLLGTPDDAAPLQAALSEAGLPWRLRVLPAPTPSPSAVWSRLAAEASQATWLGLLPPSTPVCPRLLQSLAEGLAAHPDAPALLMGPSAEPQPTRWTWLRQVFEATSPLGLGWGLIRPAVFHALGGADERFAHLGDRLLWVRLALQHDVPVFPWPEGTDTEPRAPLSESEARRLLWEQVQVLWQLRRGLNDPATFAAIFPELAETLDADAPPVDGLYAMARRALILGEGYPSPAHRILGLETLFELMGKPDSAQRLAERHGFTPEALIQLTGDVPVLAESAPASAKATSSLG